MRIPGLLLSISLIACHWIQAFEMGDLTLHGTVSQGYMQTTENNYIEDSGDGTFDLREFGINASLPLRDKASIAAQVFGRRFGSVGEDKLYLDWLVLEYAHRDSLKLRAGKLNEPLGFYGETRDIDSLRTEILLPQGVYMEYMRGLLNSAWAVAAEGYLPAEGVGGFSYSLQLGVKEINEDSGEMSRLVSGLLSRTLPINTMDVRDIDEGAAAAGALVWHTPMDGVRAGVTASWSRFRLDGLADSTTAYTADVSDQGIAVASLERVSGPLTLAMECMIGVVDADLAIAAPANLKADYRLDYWGTYLKGDYRFSDWLVVGTGYSHFEHTHTLNPAGRPESRRDGDQRDWFITTRFDVSHNLILKFEHHIVSGTSGVFQQQNPGGCTNDWTMTLAKISYIF